MSSPKVELHCDPPVLGAGKTTAVFKLAQRLKERAILRRESFPPLPPFELNGMGWPTVYIIAPLRAVYWVAAIYNALQRASQTDNN
jgi:hypothetical protein